MPTPTSRMWCVRLAWYAEGMLDMHDEPSKYHCRSIRLQQDDYTQAGLYFVTLGVGQRQRILSTIGQLACILTAFGIVLDQKWQELVRYDPRVIIDEYVLMPDHLHGIIYNPIPLLTIMVD